MAQFVPNSNALRNQALQFAVLAHGNQVRKGNEHIPYVFHCVDAANEVIYYSGLPIPELEKASILALLHDTVEDTFVTLEDIAQHFGDEIAVGVDALTKRDGMVENIARLKKAERYVQVVKLADRSSNLKTFPAMWDRDKVSSYLDESLLIARELGEASEGLHARLLSRVSQAKVTLSIM
jgi:(p)ppGpp synthase/HD superfamily hydrolase